MRYEASGDNRVFAAALFDLYRANIDAGFTEEQAMEIVNTIVFGNCVNP